eukprot:scaffold1748_cov164-Amphora_coffeaeformis.AAC.9
MVHGLAASIRAARENEVFDLGGQNAATIENTIQTAFAEPLEGLDEMIRITLVTGAGKQARQKYDEQAHKAVVTALQQVGYTEDRTASGVMECAGMYKLQHDTGKNLKTVVVYPRIASANKKSSAKDKENNEEEALIPEHVPGYKLAVASMPTFQNIIKSKCSSWSQKKGCLECLDALMDIIQSLDDKLMHGQPLSETEQSFYVVVSQLEEKKAYLKHESKQQVEQGQITALEKELLLDIIAQRLKEAPDHAKLLERQKLLKSINPIEPARLKHHGAISKLQKEVAKLLHLNENQLLSVKERQMVTRREQIWDEIAELQDASREWFEEDDVFEARVQVSRQGLEMYRSSNNKASSGRTETSSAADAKLKATTKSGAGNKWILPSQQTGSKKKKGSRNAGPGVFDAMRLRQGDDSGSDSSSDEEDGEEASTTKTMTSSTQPTELKDSSKVVTGGGNLLKSKKSKKKKKKGAGKKTNKEIDHGSDHHD